LNGLLLVPNALLELVDSFLTVSLFLLDVLHETFKDLLGLKSFLFDLSLFLLLKIEDVGFVLKRGLVLR
jgi:hypothetical protein